MNGERDREAMRQILRRPYRAGRLKVDETRNMNYRTPRLPGPLVKLLAVLAIVFVTALNAMSQDRGLRAGDILFQFIPCGPLCDAIVATTPCAKDHPFNHCGIVMRDDDSLHVLEAIGTSVRKTPLSKFVVRDTGSRVYVGRLRDARRSEIAANLDRAKALLGRPYDNSYLPGDTALYCTELVYESYLRNGRRLFKTEPMTFKSGDGRTDSGWADYYKALGRDIPEGLPGTNPCGISRDPALRLFQVDKGELLR